MGSLGSPQGWIPYENVRDCSQGFCSLYCPQWCYIIFPPPPPIAFSEDDSRTNFSPLVIAIIGILASAFLLVSYYTVISKYCGNINSSSRRNASNEELNENQNQSNSELWQVSRAGLDEALIKLITVCKYKKGDGLVEGTDCSVCLSEFEENQDLRLLPKCSHAFHLPCIDLWLKSHSNCPLCRANVVVPLQLPSPVPSDNGTSAESEQDHHTTVMVEDLERSNDEASHVNDLVPKMDGEGSEGRDIIIEIKDGGLPLFRRSVSMDSSSQGRVLIADILSNSEDEESDTETRMYQPGVESSSTRNKAGKHNKSTDRHRVLHCTMSPIAMKRSLSSGRFLFARQGRSRM